jgi:hypothetical protein
MLADARRGSGTRGEVEALKAAIEELTAQELGFPDVVALAAAAQPQWRASQQVELAEQAVWEMLHQGRLAMIAGAQPVARDEWQAIVLSWETWMGAADPPVRLQTRR